jgi:predicted outer membrane repeat protein
MRKPVYFAIIQIFLFCLSVQRVFSETLLVPHQYPTIQEALQSAQAEDFIIVAPGIYRLPYGNLTFTKDYITLKSSHGAAYTVIIGKPDKPVITVKEGLRPVIDGFTITSAKDEDFTVLRGGGIYCELLSRPEIMNNVITGNKAVFGGAIFCDDRSTSFIHNNKIFRNFAFTSGGAIFSQKASPEIRSNEFTENEAANSGGAIFCNRDSATITGNIFWKNSAKSGGGIGSERGSATVVNNTLTGNTADFGGGIMVDGGPIRMINLILWKNRDDLYYTGYSPFSKPAYSNISDGDFRGTNGNISTEPLFTDADNGIFTLEAGSPCLDAGNPEPVFFDKDGSKNDIGAYGGPNGYSEK